MSYHVVLWRGLLIDVDSRDSTLRTVLSRTKYAMMARIRQNSLDILAKGVWLHLETYYI